MTTPHNPFGGDNSNPENSDTTPYGAGSGDANPFGATSGGYEAQGAENAGYGSFPSDANYTQPLGGTRPETYMPWSIINTILTVCNCCIPIGAVAIYFSWQVGKKFQDGDVAGAQEASKTAKTLNMVFSIIVALLILFNILNYFFHWIPMADFQRSLETK